MFYPSKALSPWKEISTTTTKVRLTNLNSAQVIFYSLSFFTGTEILTTVAKVSLFACNRIPISVKADR